ncbi:hypothetical protein AAVH_32452 [Aphelenchoides avenae]|nr:hypothetical protein AAVH_32452 [Aphelenchus avenae]
MFLPDDVLMDVSTCLTRFHLDVVQYSSRRFRHVVDSSKPLSSFRHFTTVVYRGGQFELKFCAEGVPFTVQADASGASQYTEENLEQALLYLSHAYVDKFIIKEAPRAEFIDAFSSRDLTSRVNSLELSDADFNAVSGPTFAALIGGMPDMRELFVYGSHMKAEHFDDSFLRSLAARNVTTLWIAFTKFNRTPRLDDASIIDFLSVSVRGGQTNECCKIWLECEGTYTDRILVKVLEGIENGSLVSTFYLMLKVGPQRLEKYERNVTRTGETIVVHLEELDTRVLLESRCLIIEHNVAPYENNLEIASAVRAGFAHMSFTVLACAIL